MGVGVADRMIDRCLVLLFVEQINWRQYAVIYRAGLSNETSVLALRLRDKSNNLAHIRSTHRLDKQSAVQHFCRKLAVMPPIRLPTSLLFSVSSRSSGYFGRINTGGFLSSPLVVVGKSLKLTRNRSVGHGLGSAKQSLCCFQVFLASLRDLLNHHRALARFCAAWSEVGWSQGNQLRSLARRSLNRSTHFLEQRGARHE
ncbi:hypothetical protein ABIA95_002672 [Bradyrhizobium sp. LA8.1]